MGVRERLEARREWEWVCRVSVGRAGRSMNGRREEWRWARVWEERRERLRALRPWRLSRVLRALVLEQEWGRREAEWPWGVSTGRFWRSSWGKGWWALGQRQVRARQGQKAQIWGVRP